MSVNVDNMRSSRAHTKIDSSDRHGQPQSAPESYKMADIVELRGIFNFEPFQPTHFIFNFFIFQGFSHLVILSRARAICLFATLKSTPGSISRWLFPSFFYILLLYFFIITFLSLDG